MPSIEQNPERCDATDDDSSTGARLKIFTYLIQDSSFVGMTKASLV